MHTMHWQRENERINSKRKQMGKELMTRQWESNEIEEKNANRQEEEEWKKEDIESVTK